MAASMPPDPRAPIPRTNGSGHEECSAGFPETQCFFPCPPCAASFAPVRLGTTARFVPDRFDEVRSAFISSPRTSYIDHSPRGRREWRAGHRRRGRTPILAGTPDSFLFPRFFLFSARARHRHFFRFPFFFPPSPPLRPPGALAVHCIGPAGFFVLDGLPFFPVFLLLFLPRPPAGRVGQRCRSGRNPLDSREIH